MIVVADTSVILNLALVGQEELLAVDRALSDARHHQLAAERARFRKTRFRFPRRKARRVCTTAAFGTAARGQAKDGVSWKQCVARGGARG